MTSNFDLAFSPTVQNIQQRKGSRATYAKMAGRDDEKTVLNETLIDFIAARNSFYLSTASADGQPYIQHRGGPAGFLQVLDKHTLAFADFKGNRQFISQGNLSDNPKAFMFLMDYAMPRRLKIWGEARVVEDDQNLIDRLMPANYKARPEQAIIFNIKLWDLNCHQHIPPLLDRNMIADEIEKRDQRIAALEAQLLRLNPKET